jgi:hypothetical protein
VRRDCLIVLAIMVLLGPIPASATVICEGGRPRGADRAVWRCTGPCWLVGRGAAVESRALGSTGLFQSEVGQTPWLASDAPSMTGWQRAGAYTLEFGGAAVGTVAAFAGAVGVYQLAAAPDPSNELLMSLSVALGFSTCLLTGPSLAATGTYFGGRLVGQKGSFWRTLVGSFAGGAVGWTGAYGYGQLWHSRHSYWGPTQNAISLACVAVPAALGAVVAYNVWRDGE